jgi:glutamate 5-kinase
MMRNRSLAVALVALLIAPAAAFAQQGGGMRGGMGQGGMGALMAARNLLEQGNVEFLLTKATELQLTAEQSAALKSIGEKFASDTKEPREQLRSVLPQAGQGMGGMGGGDMQAMAARFEQLAPVMLKLVEDDQKAVDEALKHLDDGQKTKARELIEARIRPRRQGS